MVNIKFAKCRKEAKLPLQQPGSAGLDIYACFEEDYIRINPFQCKLIPTGIKSVIEPGYFVLFEERGSTGSKGIKKNSGVIDADFRGEWWVCIYNTNNVPLFISKISEEELKEKEFLFTSIIQQYIYYPYSKAIAQGLVLPSPVLEIEECTEQEIINATTIRGEGQLGSSNH